MTSFTLEEFGTTRGKKNYPVARLKSDTEKEGLHTLRPGSNVELYMCLT